ncbi:MAG: hypothetical protein ACREYE_08190 [Gammaproteobacteria bacterium]
MKKPTALGISRSGGARNPHVFQYTPRFLRSGGTRPSFARDGFFTNSQAPSRWPPRVSRGYAAIHPLWPTALSVPDRADWSANGWSSAHPGLRNNR